MHLDLLLRYVAILKYNFLESNANRKKSHYILPESVILYLLNKWLILQ